MGVMTYDDLLTRLDETLKGDGGVAAAARLRERYRVVLVDEFQDTDPVQWDIMRRAFGDGSVTLVLIGDPKQAIYAFRGADVYAYLEAARAAGARATLDVNWRSDQGLIDAYDALFGGARLGHEGIVYRQVRAADANHAPRLSGAPECAPLRVRVVSRDDPAIKRTRGGSATNASAREHIARDLAADLSALLASGAQIEIRDDDGSVRRREAIRPGHVAVLVRTHRTAALARDALDKAGIPAVINGAGSVFATTPARDWLRLLEALERPTSSPRARSAALTPFLGWTAERVASAGEDEWEELHRRLHQWARVLRAKGVAALAETITLVEGLPERVLREVDGERRLTDLRHVGHLLHAVATGEHMGTTALTAWLRAQIADAGEDTTDEDRSRRLESDAEAVQVLTIHRSKGLEFPVVYYPYLWEPGYIPREPQPIFFHDPDAGDARVIDVGLDGPDFPAHRSQHEAEQRGEDLRLAYVALTRAQHQAVVWWAGSWDSRHSALGRLLFSREPDGNVPAGGTSTPSDAAATARFEALAAAAPGCVSVERATLGPAASWSGAPPAPPALAAARFDRRLDSGWRRTSYSDITAGTHEARVASEPEEPVVTDEEPAAFPPAAADGDDEAAALRAVPSLLAAMPAGVHVGTFVHRVLEATDFAVPDLEAELAARVEAEQARRRLDVGDHEAVVAGLRAAIETPLGPLLGGSRLRDVGARGPPRRARVRAAARRRRRADRARRAVGDRRGAPRRRRARRLRATSRRPCAAPERSRLPHREHRPRRARARSRRRAPLRGRRLQDELARRSRRGADRLAPSPRSAGRRDGARALRAAGPALHRRAAPLPALASAGLRRPTATSPACAYLFVRGMVGAATPVVDGVPCGVFAWRPSAAVVEGLSDALDMTDAPARARPLRCPPRARSAWAAARVQPRGCPRRRRRARRAATGGARGRR